MYYQLLLFVLINSGITTAVTRSKLTEKFRNFIDSKNKFFGYQFNCTLCFGFWSAIPVYFFVYNRVGLDLNLLAFMFIGSFTSYFLNRISNI